MTKVKVEGAIEVIEGQLDCIKQSMAINDDRMREQLIMGALRMIVLAANEATKD